MSKVSDSEAESAERQAWLQFAVACKYMGRDVGRELYREYEAIIAMLVRMINRPKDWLIR